MIEEETSRPDFFVAGGALRSHSPSYVDRPADLLLRELAASGRLCYVLTTRQMGKSSLMYRTESYLREQGIHTVIIDLTLTGTAPIDPWYLSLLYDLQSQLGLRIDPEEWWEGNSFLPPVRRFTKFVEEVIPEEIDGRITIFIDEVDYALNLDFADDFFAAIRAIYNRGAASSTLERISFILLGVAAPSDLIRDQTRTPFNIGERIKLEELAFDDAQIFLQGIPEQGEEILERVFHWTEGHPYLTQKIGLSIARQNGQNWTDVDVDNLIKELFLTGEAVYQEENLQFVRKRILSSPNKKELLTLYRKVYDGRRIQNNEQSNHQNELKLYGLLRSDQEGFLRIRNQIYREVFDREWIKENTPVNWWRWAALTTAVFAMIVIIFGIIYWRQAPQPDDVLLQSYTSSFQETANPTLRLDNLANIFALESYESEAIRLFESLTNDEQIAMFEAATPDLTPQVQQVVQGTYSTLFTTDLHQTEDTNRLLQAMFEALEQSTDANSRALRDEIGIWLEGRRYAENEEYLSARTAYGLAINLNDENPATHFERALTAILVDEYVAAIDDFSTVWGHGSEWEQMVLFIVNGDNGLQVSVRGMDESPPFVSFVFTPTPTSTPTSTSTPTYTPTSTPTSTRQPSPTNTAVPTHTRTPQLEEPTITPEPVVTLPVLQTATLVPSPVPQATLPPQEPTNQPESTSPSSGPSNPPEPTSPPQPTDPPPDPTDPPDSPPTRPPTPLPP